MVCLYHCPEQEDNVLIKMYTILNLLYTSDCKSKLVAATLKQIHEALGEAGEKMSEKTVYLNIRKLSASGYIAEGLLHGNAKSFYITSLGIDWMKEVEGESDNEQK